MPVPDPDPAGPTTRTINGLFQPRIDHAAGATRVLAHRQHRREHLLPAQPRRAAVLRHRAGRQPAEPGRRRPIRCSYRPASASRHWSTARSAGHVRACRRRLQHRPGRRRVSGAAAGDRRLAAARQVARDPAADDVPAAPDLRQHRIDRQRTIVFADTANPNQFTINGKPYNPNCVDTVVDARRRRGVDDPEHRRTKRTCSTSTSSTSRSPRSTACAAVHRLSGHGEPAAGRRRRHAEQS